MKNKTALPLPPEVNVILTIAEFGYDPRELKPWSRKRVVAECYITGKIAKPTRASLNLSKSVQETGHYTTHGADATKRKGRKCSDITKAKMRRSQSQRRRDEKQNQELKEVA